MKETVNLSEGSIIRGMMGFTIPIILGQLLQQLYNVADAWVIGYFADNASFAAVSSSGSLAFLVVGFFNGLAIGGGVVISTFFGAGDKEKVSKAIHTNILFGIISSVIVTVLFLLLIPYILTWMRTPENIYSHSLDYFRIYFGGICTVIMYNFFMTIMRSLGDSKRPLIYLIVSSVVNIALDLLFVAVFGWGVKGAAAATVIAQGISCNLCLIKMCRSKSYISLSLRKLRLYPDIMRAVIKNGLPAGIQYSAISIGNLVVQSNINSFGEFAVAGLGAHSKIEGFAFVPIAGISTTLSTFVSQNIGAGQPKRALKGSIFGCLFGMTFAEVIGIVMYIFVPQLLGFFCSEPRSIEFGTVQAHIVTFLYFLLAFSHCATGVLRGLGKSVTPMVGMMAFWCVVRILFVTFALKIFPDFRVIPWAYPITWLGSTVIFIISMLRYDWSGNKKSAVS